MNIEQIARLARISTATISRTINGSPKVREKTAERVRKIIAEAGYVPNQSARTLSMGRSQLFGIVISDITNPFFPELVSSFEGLCLEENYDTILANTNYDVHRLHRCLIRMIERRVDGIAIFTSEMDDLSTATLLQHKVPVVTLAQGIRNSPFHTIYVDYRPGINKAVQHLVDLGHTDIAFITGPKELWSTRRRLEVFNKALLLSGLSPEPKWISEGNNRQDSGWAAMKSLLSLKRRPTAVLCSNDLMAIGALRAVQETGLRVPNDISLIGFDNLEMVSLANPPLASIQIPRLEIANRAFQILLNAAKDAKAKKCKCTLATKLVLRQSTSPPPRRRQK